MERDDEAQRTERNRAVRDGTGRTEPCRLNIISFSVDAKRIRKKKSDAGKQLNDGTGEDERERRKARKKMKRDTNGMWRDGTERRDGKVAGGI